MSDIDAIYQENAELLEAVNQSNIRIRGMLALLKNKDKKLADAITEIIELQKIQSAAQQMLGIIEYLLQAQRGKHGIYIKEDEIQEHLNRWRIALKENV